MTYWTADSDGGGMCGGDGSSTDGEVMMTMTIVLVLCAHDILDC